MPDSDSRIQDLEEALKGHAAHEDEIFKEMRSDIRTIKENHLAHIQQSVVQMQADVGWIKLGLLAILGGIIKVYFK